MTEGTVSILAKNNVSAAQQRVAPDGGRTIIVANRIGCARPPRVSRSR
jgi:hypothetical protein